MSRLAISLFLFAATACTSSSTKSSIDTADTGTASPTSTGTPPAGSSGGCEWMGAYCYDFDGPSWDATSAASACDDFNASAAAAGAPAGTFVAAGCPSGAAAQCTGFAVDPTDPGTSFTLYYYGSPIPEVEVACTSEGGTYTEL